MLWRFSDGTTVELGCKVDGPTLLAQRLRQELERQDLRVRIWPPPGGDVELDRNDPAIVEAWLRQELDFWTRRRGLPLRLTSPKGIPPLPPPPWAGQPHDPDVHY